MNEKILISSQEMRTIIERLTFQIIEKCQDLENICIVGIRRRGIYIAKQIEEYLRKHNRHNFSTGSIDITLSIKISLLNTSEELSALSLTRNFASVKSLKIKTFESCQVSP